MAEVALEAGLAPPAPSNAKALRVGRASSSPLPSSPCFILFSCTLGLLLGTRPSCLPQGCSGAALFVAASSAPAQHQGFGAHTLQFKLKHQYPPERALWVPAPHWCTGWHLAGGAFWQEPVAWSWVKAADSLQPAHHTKDSDVLQEGLCW